MKKMKIISLAIVSVLLLGCMSSIPAHAGMEVTSTDVLNSESQLNSSDWYFMGDISYDSEKKAVQIPADSSDSDTRFVSKVVSTSDELLADMSTVKGSLKITALPAGQEVIFAFGLSTIEGNSGETGNVEIAISNNAGYKLGVKAYEEEKETTVLEPKSIGVSLNREFQFEAKVTNKQILIVKINGSVVCEKKIPVTAEGRFGVLQTGGCGLSISSLTLVNHSYARPENTNISENFENGDFNANELCSAMVSVGIGPGSHTVEDFKGNKVYMMRNAALSYIGTKNMYSNFEISFDIPYWPSKDILDEDGNRLQLSGHSICIGWGETVQEPLNKRTYSENIDMIQLNKDSAASNLKKNFTVNYKVEGMPTLMDDEGYSVKFSFVDGHAELSVKPLNEKNYTMIQEVDYTDIRSGYVKLWTLNGGTLAIDNLKITNKDQKPNVIDVEHKSSITVFEDYDISQESTELVFRPNSDKIGEEETKFSFAELSSGTKTLVILNVVTAVVLIAVGITSYVLLKRKKQGGKTDEKA